jgi:hypothetical protein
LKACGLRKIYLVRKEPHALRVKPRKASSGADDVQPGHLALRFEGGDLLLVTSGKFVMRCTYRRMHSGLLGRLLLGQSLLIVSKILFHAATPGRQTRSEVPRLARRLIHLAVDGGLTV